MKIAFIEGHMPELKGPKAFQSGRGEGTNAPAAISRAFKDMLRKVKGKRISVIKTQITLTTKAEQREHAVEEIEEIL